MRAFLLRRALPALGLFALGVLVGNGRTLPRDVITIVQDTSGAYVISTYDRHANLLTSARLPGRLTLDEALTPCVRCAPRLLNTD